MTPGQATTEALERGEFGLSDLPEKIDTLVAVAVAATLAKERGLLSEDKVAGLMSTLKETA